MKSQEGAYMCDVDYIKNVQKEMKDTSRAFLIEWIIDVHRKFKLLSETLYVTVSIIDRYLSRVSIEKKQLHILGVAAILIATKYEEIYPPEMKELLSVSENKFTKQEVLKMESQILFSLEFDFFAPSALRFLERFRKLASSASEERVFYFAQYLCEISLLDITLMRYKPSCLAGAALILASRGVKGNNGGWSKEMEKCTGYKEEDLKEAMQEVKSFALEINPKFLETLKYKFSKQEYFEVAKLDLKVMLR